MCQILLNGFSVSRTIYISFQTTLKLCFEVLAVNKKNMFKWQYRGSPTNSQFFTALVSEEEFVLGVILRELCVMQFFSSPKIHVMRRPSVHANFFGVSCSHNRTVDWERGEYKISWKSSFLNQWRSITKVEA